jgi:hypothetical protein
MDYHQTCPYAPSRSWPYFNCPLYLQYSKDTLFGLLNLSRQIFGVMADLDSPSKISASQVEDSDACEKGSIDGQIAQGVVSTKFKHESESKYVQ